MKLIQSQSNPKQDFDLFTVSSIHNRCFLDQLSEAETMSRAMLLVFLLIIMIITSQFEWKQQLISDSESTPSVSNKQQQSLKREESVKEKIILSQEKNIQRLNELVHNLKEELRQCRSINETTIGTLSSLAESVIELERQQILED